MTLRLQIIGGGNMGEALLTGLLKAEWATPKNLAVIEPVPDRQKYLENKFPGVVTKQLPVKAVDALLAVKPADVGQALQMIGQLNIPRVLSIAAGVRLQTIEENLSQSGTSTTLVMRAMPNTPAMVGAGASALAGGSNITEEDLLWAEEILGTVGKVVRVKEQQLDAVTGLSGSGPAYVFYLAEALIAAGIEAGLSPEVVNSLVKQTLLGSAQLMMESDLSPAELRAAVTSPQGTTERGIQVLQSAGVKEIFEKAVKQATERATEMAAEYAHPKGADLARPDDKTEEKKK